MGDISNWHVEQMSRVNDKIPTVNIGVDTRSILHRFDSEAIKKVANDMYSSGIKPDPNYEGMTINIMRKSGPLTDKQKNALITFIMYGQ